ncbi:MAG: patatin-like phospholipase family protein [Bacteroidota bacterium]
MDLSSTGLILEGGGLRGVYTSGVLQFFMEHDLYFPYVIGVSMGACNAANYISHQPERNRIVNIAFVNDRRYLSYLRLVLKGELFGMNFIFDTIPNKLVPFDFTTFFNSPQRCFTTVTDCITGRAVYFERNELGKDYMKMLQASSSLPFISKPVEYKGRIYMDGGLSDSIPIRKSIEDGNKKHVIILTQPEGYRKEPEGISALTRLRYPKFTGLVTALENRHLMYNETIEFIEELRRQGSVFIIRPSAPLKAGRIERSKQTLYSVYDTGYKDAENCYAGLCSFMSTDPCN